MRAILDGDAMVGTKMRARTPRRRAAWATATPWFPPEAATTPAAGTSRRSRFAKAPRTLKDPACCRSSSFRNRETPGRPRSAPSTATTGVTRTWGRKASAVAATSSRPRFDNEFVTWQITLYASCVRGQGPGQRAPPADPGLAEGAARPLPAPGGRGPRAGRGLQRLHRAQAASERPHRQRAPARAQPGRARARQADQAVDVLPP